MKKIILLIAFTISSTNLLSQKDTKILVTINDKQISVADFKKVYEKNLDAIDNEESKDIDKNLDLFINYKLKVKEVLSHYGRLDAWIPFYLKTLDSLTKKPSSKYYQDSFSKKYNIKIANNLEFNPQ